MTVEPAYFPACGMSYGQSWTGSPAHRTQPIRRGACCRLWLRRSCRSELGSSGMLLPGSLGPDRAAAIRGSCPSCCSRRAASSFLRAALCSSSRIYDSPSAMGRRRRRAHGYSALESAATGADSASSPGRLSEFAAACWSVGTCPTVPQHSSSCCLDQRLELNRPSVRLGCERWRKSSAEVGVDLSDRGEGVAHIGQSVRGDAPLGEQLRGGPAT